MASNRQEDGGPVDAAGTATDQAGAQNRLLDSVGGRLGDRDAQCRQDSCESEHSAAARVMGMTLAAAGIALTFEALVLNRDARCLVDVMMHRPVTVDVNMLVDALLKVTLNVQSGNLLGDLIEAIGRGAVAECERNRRHEDPCEVDQRDDPRDPASRPAG